MARLNDLPFARGTTYFGGGTTNTTDGANLEGKEYMVEDVADASGTGGNGTGMYVKLRVVRNKATFSLVGKRLIYEVAGLPGQTAGYAAVNPPVLQVMGVVDDQYALTSTTVPANDLFYAVVQGPCLVKTALEGDVTNSIAAWDWLLNTTAVTSGATSAGRAADIALSGATSVLANQILNTWGRALSAKTTANTDADLLCMVGRVY